MDGLDGLLITLSVADLFVTVRMHTVIPDFNCIIVRLELTGQEHEFKVRRGDTEEPGCGGKTAA